MPRIRKRRNKKRNLETKLLAFELMFIFLSYYVNVFIQDGLGIKFSVSIFFYVLAFIIGVVAYIRVLSRGRVLSYGIVLFFLIGTILFSIINRKSVNLIFVSFTEIVNSPVLILFFYCLPVLLLVINGRINYRKLYHYLVQYSKIILALFLVCFFVFRVGTESLATTYMPFSYNAVISICVCLSYKEESKLSNVLNKVLGLASSFVVLIAGARGALICIICFALLLIFGSRKIKTGKKIALLLSLTLVATLGIVFFNDIIKGIGSLLEQNGVYSRTIERLADSSFFKGSDRIELWSKVINATTSSPIIGYGLWGDRPIVNGYCHNFFVEIIGSFGFVGGGIIIVVILFLIIGYILSRRAGDNYRFSVFLCALPYGFIQLMFSDSYLMNIWFFFVLGTLILNTKPKYMKKKSPIIIVPERVLFNE